MTTIQNQDTFSDAVTVHPELPGMPPKSVSERLIAEARENLDRANSEIEDLLKQKYRLLANIKAKRAEALDLERIVKAATPRQSPRKTK